LSSIKQFFEENPVFTVAEFKQAFGQGRTLQTLQTQLKQYKQNRYIDTLRRGVYFVKGLSGKALPDEFLVLSKLAADSLIAYHSAFDLLGFGHSLFHSLYYLTANRQHPLNHGSFRYVPLPYPLELARKGQNEFGIEKVERLGIKVRVTGKERTLVDCLDHTEYAGGFEELYRCAEKLPYLSFELLYQYLTLRDRKTLFAKVGFFLEQHREAFHVEESFLHKLKVKCPLQIVYWERSGKHGILKKHWNLIVPAAVANRKWEEF
jgi:predicted transcriptional regulator of viral defense system